MKDRHEKRSCGCVLLHRRVFVCERHAELPEEVRDTISEMGSRVIAEEVKANVSEILRKATKLCRFIIENRGCTCNVPGHRCGTNLMLEDVAKLEEYLS